MRGPKSVRLALLQMQVAAGDIEANLARIDAAAERASAGGAALLVAPELALTGYGAGEAIRDLAEPADGPQVQRLQAMARRHRIALVAGFAERAEARVFNSLAFVEGEGAPKVYRKTHLYADYERALFTPGKPQATLHAFHGLTLGFLICYDVEFPENVRRLARAGAELVLVPTALPQGPFAAFIATSVVPVRAFENQVFVAYANHAGRDDRFAYAGLSRVAGPDGASLTAASDDREVLLFADIDPGAYEASRHANTYLADL